MARRTRAFEDAEASDRDVALLRAAAARDMAAFERLYRRFRPRLLGFALRLGASTWIFGIA